MFTDEEIARFLDVIHTLKADSVDNLSDDDLDLAVGGFDGGDAGSCPECNIWEDCRFIGRCPIYVED